VLQAMHNQLKLIAMGALRGILVGLVIVIALVPAVACDHPSAADNPVSSNTPSGSGVKMTPTESATDAFKTYVAKQVGISPSQVEARLVGNSTLGTEIDPELTIGSALPFRGAKLGPDGSLVPPLFYGWATPDGITMTLKHNFGALLEQAGVWSNKPSADIEKLPRAVAWLLNEGQLRYHAGGTPIIELRPDGAGTVTIPLDYQEGGGGGYVSPVMKYNAVAKVTKDHQATVTLVKVS
jgi:hypothetical protein